MKDSISKANDKPTRWLITGGCGFIGTSLIKNLVSEGGHIIRVLDNLSVGTRKDLARVCTYKESSPEQLSQSSSPSEASQSSALSPQSSSGTEASQSSVLSPQHLNNQSSYVELIVGDILDFDLVMKMTQNVDVIVHLAANTGVGPSVEDPKKDMESNVIGTFNMLEAARHNGLKRFVFASSGAPVGECDPPIHEELAPHPVSPYGASKLAGEGYCSSYYRTFGIETIALRFGNVYGPGSTHKNSVVAKFIKQAMQGETLEIYGDGNQTRDFIYIDDLITAILKAALSPSFNPKSSACPVKSGNHSTGALSPQSSSETEAPDSSLLTSNSSLIFGEVFQIATNQETTVLEMTNKLLPVLSDFGYKNVTVEHGEPRQGDVKRNFSDTTKAKQLLGWTNKVDRQEGIEKTVSWFVKKDS